jgi:tetratricopeptide (TPR) repeat protein
MKDTQDDPKPQDEKEPTKSRKRWIPLLSVVLTLTALAGAYYYYAEYYSQRHLKVAKAYEAMGDYPSAIESYKKHLLKNGDDLAAKFDFAKALLKAKRRGEAIEILGILRRDAGANKELRNQTFDLLSSLEALDKAHEAFDTKAWAQARSYYRDAIEYLKRSGVNDSGEIIGQARYNICNSFWNERKWRRAEKCLFELREKHPRYREEEVDALLEKALLQIRHD